MAGRFLRLEKRQVEVYLVSRRAMKKNVLAYPAPRNFPRPDLFGKESLGEIHLNPDYIKRHNQNIILMLIHGLLHLLGYDHQKKSDRMKMERMERKLRRAVKN